MYRTRHRLVDPVRQPAPGPVPAPALAYVHLRVLFLVLLLVLCPVEKTTKRTLPFRMKKTTKRSYTVASI
jgi:hypothetical protein